VLVGGAQVLVRRNTLFGRIGYVSLRARHRRRSPQGAVVAALADALEGLGRTRLCAFVVQPVEGDDVSAALLARGFRDSMAGGGAGSDRADRPVGHRGGAAGRAE